MFKGRAHVAVEEREVRVCVPAAAAYRGQLRLMSCGRFSTESRSQMYIYVAFN